MNTVEDLLREGMERFTRDLRAPAGLTRRVVRRRRRRLALRSGVAAALTAGAVAVVAVVVPGARDDSADPTAYVVKRVDGALRAAEPGEIAQVTVTTRTGMPDGTTVTTSTEEWSYGDRWRAIVYSPGGPAVYDEGSTAPPPAGPVTPSQGPPPAAQLTLVSYLNRTWARSRELAGPVRPISGPGGCGPAVAALPLLFQPELPHAHVSAGSPAAVARALRSAISCGALTVAGRQRVNGIDAIELTGRSGPPISVWVSPGTYLPVRVVVRSTFHHELTINNQPVLQSTANITWLPLNAQNLAKLTVPIPAGFRHVPLPEAVGPILQQFPAGLAKGGPGPLG
jgi:hypothetical protein